MKNMNKVRTFALLLGVAAGCAVQAQEMIIPEGSVYTFTGTAATGTGITYQWYRNGQPIANATGASYTLPANLANGTNVEFKRGVMSSSCSSEVFYNNPFVITFVKNGMGIGNFIWATTNVDSYQTFAANPDMYTKFYQWNKSTAYSATNPITPAWNSTANTAATWSVNPCPAGWRLPAKAEFTDLAASGSTWVAATANRGNAIDGRFYGPNNATCTLPSNMVGCIFLPAAGMRDANGALASQISGLYWAVTQSSNTTDGQLLLVTASPPPVEPTQNKACALLIRCVQNLPSN